MVQGNICVNETDGELDGTLHFYGDWTYSPNDGTITYLGNYNNIHIHNNSIEVLKACTLKCFNINNEAWGSGGLKLLLTLK